MDEEDKRMERLGTHELEIGVTEALQRHVTRHVHQPPPVSQRRIDFEHKRPRLLRECLAEVTGVFFYVLPGIAAVTSFTLPTTNGLGEAVGVAALGGVPWIGIAFALGIAFAIITCASTSGGHFNPAITICFVIWNKFPPWKACLYILSQIFGAFLAGLVLMGCYWPEISAAKAVDIKAHGTAVFNGGIASILCPFPNADQTNQGFLFFQEFMVDFYIGILIWSCLDPANPFVSPASVPFTIGLVYATMVIGFAGNTISTNLARDVGPRIVAAIFFGKEAFTFNHGYPWISILVNIPATITATCFYEFLMRDSLQKIASGHAKHEGGEDGLVRHLTRIGTENQGIIIASSKAKEHDV